MSGGHVRSIGIEWVCMEYSLCFSMSLFLSPQNTAQSQKQGSLVNCVSCALTFCVNLVLNKRCRFFKEKVSVIELGKRPIRVVKEGSQSVSRTAGTQTWCTAANIYLDPHYCIPALVAALFMLLCIHTAACGFASPIWILISSAVPTQTDFGIPLRRKQSGIIHTSAMKANLKPMNLSQWDEGQETCLALMWIKITRGKNAHEREAL